MGRMRVAKPRWWSSAAGKQPPASCKLLGTSEGGCLFICIHQAFLLIYKKLHLCPFLNSNSPWAWGVLPGVGHCRACTKKHPFKVRPGK